MTRQSSAAVHARLVAQTQRPRATPAQNPGRRHDDALLRQFAAGEASGWWQGYRAGSAMGAVMSLACFVAGLVLAPLILPAVIRSLA